MKLRAIIVAIACALFATSAQAANQPGAVVQLPNIARLSQSDFSNTPQVQLSGYYTANDGGEGTLVYMAMGCGGYDGISCFVDNAGNQYYRTNLNGDMRQGGVTKGSVYDANANPTTATDATPIISAAYTALRAIGLYRVDTKQVSIILRTILTLPSSGDLTCSIETGGPFSNGNYTNRPGTIYTAHNAYIHASNNSVSVHNCMGLPEWYINPSVVSAFGGYSFNNPPTVEADMEAYRGNMVRAADMWLYSDNARAAKYNHIWVYGFDNPVRFNKPNEVDMSFCWLDGSISLYSTGGGSSTSVQTCRSEPYLRRQVSVGWTGPGNIPNQEDFSIRTITAGAVNSWGTHECRLTIQSNASDPYPVTDIHVSDNDSFGQAVTFGILITNLDMAGAAGGPGAVSCIGTGPWPTHNLSYNSGTQTLTLDLLGSQLGSGADKIVLTGTWEGGENTSGCLCATIRVASGDMHSLYPGETITGTGIGAGTTIKAVIRPGQGPDPWSFYLGEIVVQFAAGNAPVRQSGITTLTVDAGTYAPSGTDCGSQSDNGYGCVYLNSAINAIAGSSAAGLDIAAMPLNQGKPTAASWFWHDTVGLRFINVQNFNHAINFANFASNACTLIGDGGDDNGEIDWTGVLGFYIAGSTNHCNIYGGSLGKSGTPIVIDTWSNSANDSHTATLSGSLGTGGAGTTITVASGFNTFSKDAWGIFGLHICQTIGSGDTDCFDGSDPAAGSEVISCLYISNTTCTVVGRGLYGTTATSYTNGAHIFSYLTGFGSNIVQFYGTGENNTEQDLNSFQIIHGGFGLFGDIERGNTRSAYISHNVYLAKFTANIMTGLYIVYEDATALAAVAGCVNTFAIVQSWECYSPIPVNPVTTSVTIDGSSRILKCDATGGPVQFNVNAGSTLANFEFSVTKTDSSSNLCIVTMNAGDLLGGATATALAIINDSLKAKNINGTTAWMFTQ